MAKVKAADPAALKRTAPGQYASGDGRFTVEQESAGTWVVVDGEQTDELGLPLVRGPFASLTSAKAAIAGARAGGPAASPLAEQIERRRREPAEPDAPASRREGSPTTATRHGPEGRGGARAGSPDEAAAAGPAGRASPGRRRREPGDASPGPDDAAREPGWLADLDAAGRGRARRLIARLMDDGASDAEGIVRRDVVGGVPAIAARAIARRLAELGSAAAPGEVADALADGRDERLGVRWRLVDGDGRPIVLEPERRRR